VIREIVVDVCRMYASLYRRSNFGGPSQFLQGDWDKNNSVTFAGRVNRRTYDAVFNRILQVAPTAQEQATIAFIWTRPNS